MIIDELNYPDCPKAKVNIHRLYIYIDYIIYYIS